ncbi:MAG: 16S rRNA (cytosine(967)-C(5))-methyltransferase RsmB, partial [Deltaproteobacteria bacterium]|nr:16S rRNA (cytosine(967)-C(5))-methyltransferase RsmB [Deltaproteobacteria bacterium]
MAVQAKSGNGREGAWNLLIRFDAGDTRLDTLVEQEFKELSTQERAFAVELVYGVLRWRIKIDWIIDLKAKVKTKKMEHRVLNTVRLGVYQLLFLTKVPPHAIIDESVKLLGSSDRRKRGFVNALLRGIDDGRDGVIFPNLKESPARYLSVVHSHPEWLIKRWFKRHGTKETIALCQANNRRPTLTLRTNTLCITREQLLEDLLNKGIQAEPSRYSPIGIEIQERPAVPLGLAPEFYLQDEASQLVPYLLAPKPGEIILDACAAPGGKATELAQLMENKGKVYAMDISSQKVPVIEESASRLGAIIISAVRGDALKRIEFVPHGGFDAILIDAPCSGLGVVRRNPDIKYRKGEEDIERLRRLQSAIMENLASCLKDGGRIVYSTCSIEPEENEEVIDGFLTNHPEFVIEGAADFLPETCRPLVDSDGFLRTLPSRDSMDGFFAA